MSTATAYTWRAILAIGGAVDVLIYSTELANFEVLQHAEMVPHVTEVVGVGA